MKSPELFTNSTKYSGCLYPGSFSSVASSAAIFTQPSMVKSLLSDGSVIPVVVNLMESLVSVTEIFLP